MTPAVALQRGLKPPCVRAACCSSDACARAAGLFMDAESRHLQRANEDNDDQRHFENLALASRLADELHIKDARRRRPLP